MKIIVSFLLPFIAVCLSSCRSGEGGDDVQGGEPIAFNAEVWSRGATITQENITDFGVFTYYTGLNTWEEAGMMTAPNKLYNEKVSKNGSNWEYEHDLYWTDPDGNKVGLNHYFHFLGYAPYVDANNASVQVNTSVASKGAPTLTYTSSYIIANQVDLLVANPRLNLFPIGNWVSMRFTHALARIGFSANIIDAAAGSTYQVTKITIKYDMGSGYVYRKAVIDLATLQWSLFEEPFDEQNEMQVPIKADVSLSSTMQYLSREDNNLFYIPQEILQGAATVSFTIKKDAETKTIAGVSVPAGIWEAGKFYNYQYIINYASSDIALSNVVIVDWTTTSGGSMDIY